MLKCLGEPMTEAEIVEIIEDADVDKDGLIDYHEFYQMRLRRNPKQEGCSYTPRYSRRIAFRKICSIILV